MFANFPWWSKTENAIDREIAAVLHQMDTIGVLADEYPKLMALLERLNRVKTSDRPKPISRETVALIVGNLLGIGVIVAYEQKHVITSKAFNERLRLRQMDSGPN